MEYKVNPSKIFIEKCIKSNKVSKDKRHSINSERSICFKPFKKYLPYYDHIETSGLYSSLIYQYGVDENKIFESTYHIVFPTFRKKPDETRSSFCVQIKDPFYIFVNNKKYKQTLNRFIIDGFLNVHMEDDNLCVVQDILCSDDYPGILICNHLTNKSDEDKKIVIKNMIDNIPCDDTYLTKPYHIEAFIHSNNKRKKVYDRITLKPNESYSFSYVILCKYDDDKSRKVINPSKTFQTRYMKLLDYDMLYNVETNNDVINTMFHFSKVRSAESVFNTECGLLHSPGGGNYYAAIWTNDQCEYAAPLFAYFDDVEANLAIINTFLQFEKYMYTDKDLVTSIIAEGRNYWNGAKDRGDAAMYAYGLANYLLTKGDFEIASYNIKPLTWCIEHTLKKKNEYGLIMSDSDELENRFESGKCNLATNAIFYQALIKTAALFKEFDIENNYIEEAIKLKDNINKYFYENDKCIYCKEETHLRSHVVYPLIMGIYDHSEEIINTIMDERLYTENGFKTIDNCETYWDRITLMAIRGLFNANKSNLAYEILEKYSETRLLKDHVPYAIEAYPEGNQAHLAAESALYARIFLEGILGYEPLSFSLFKLHLSIPDAIDYMNVDNITICGVPMSIAIRKVDDKYSIEIDEICYYKEVDNYEDVIIDVTKDYIEEQSVELANAILEEMHQLDDYGIDDENDDSEDDGTPSASA